MLNKITNRPFLIPTVSVGLLVAGLHHFATTFSLYWTLEWFDIPMHFLGGLWVGYFALLLFFSSGLIKVTINVRNAGLIFLIVIFSVLVVGLTWELWELFVGLSDRLTDRLDSFVDIIMDLIGGTVAFYYGNKKLNGKS